ncbi:TerB-C domain-containing protein [Chitinophaga sp. CF118]|uniref:tellurite resistance TerB C-terminal domain-containing protein n=1 Tax=Chitinophaga sp. CF118 TaxID=1884367 RepID=UPI0008E0565C|nr:tellurite resistance TerB C-terminal domain-containing protein [Chitinophaga sp. CF118]SFD86394.1 TerB-C domain-containing protein [Chitinophaga sp. CF118]
MTNNLNPDKDIIDVANMVSPQDLQIPVPSNNILPDDFEHLPGYDSDEFKLGHRYKTKLNLNTEEITWLNKFDCYRNAFNSIDGCEVAIIKLFLLAVKMLNKRLKKEDASLEKEMEEIRKKAKESIPLMSEYFYNYDDNYVQNAAEAEAFYTIYKKAEVVVREAWGHKRKISAEFNSYSPQAKQQFASRLEPLIDEIVTYLKPTIGETNEQIELDLNATTTTRWKERMTDITSAYSKAQHAESVEALYRLGRQNLRNPTRGNIYYEAAKFIAPYDRHESLRLYLHYIYHDLKSTKPDQKQLNKSIQKKLFANEAQLAQFLDIVNGLIKDMNLLKSLTQVDTMYVPKRRKIELDHEQIRIVTQEHSGTVEILNGYLQEDEMIHETTEEVVVISKVPESHTSSPLTPLQIEFLQLFPEDHQLSAVEVEAFAIGKGMFKNQLLDGINDTCYELLDDVLVEEEDDYYVINSDYYNKIFA